MNVTVLLNVLLILGLSQAQLKSSEESDETDLLTQFRLTQSNQGKRKVLRRSTRNAMSGMAKKYIPELEQAIINSCKANGKFEAAAKLQRVFDELQVCGRKKKIFVTPREEYLAFMEDCFADSIKKVKNCVRENQRYFPDLIMVYVKSMINFLYNNFDIIRVDMVACYPKLNDIKVIQANELCLEEVALRTLNNSSETIPSSKAEYCRVFVPTAYCFTNMIKENCNRTPGLAKYREDYINSHKEACEEKET